MDVSDEFGCVAPSPVAASADEVNAKTHHTAINACRTRTHVSAFARCRASRTALGRGPTQQNT